MIFDVAYRHAQALDPSALGTLTTALHAIERAVDDCRRAGCDPETDAAVRLLACHLGVLARAGSADEAALRRACTEAIVVLRRSPVLPLLAARGVAYDEDAKRLFHADGRRALKRLADTLGLADGEFAIRSNQGGPAVSGEITLHGEQLYVQLSLGFSKEVLFRSVRGRHDFTGGQNHWASVHELLAPGSLAARIRRELRLPLPDEAPARLFA